MPPYPYHVMVLLARQHRRELHREADRRALARRARAETEVAGRRPLPLRLLGRILGPR